MEKELNSLYNKIREEILNKIKTKNIDLEELLDKLEISKNDFINYFTKRNDNFILYLQTYSLLEHWEG